MAKDDLITHRIRICTHASDYITYKRSPSKILHLGEQKASTMQMQVTSVNIFISVSTLISVV